jgi:hypothetical protein
MYYYEAEEAMIIQLNLKQAYRKELILRRHR